jgi:hypothetical protein
VKDIIDRPVSEHFCSLPCELSREPCDLCLAQRRHKTSQKDLEEGRPTLRYNPFANLLKKG